MENPFLSVALFSIFVILKVLAETSCLIVLRIAIGSVTVVNDLLIQGKGVHLLKILSYTSVHQVNLRTQHLKHLLYADL